jgi:hypothetical protein
MSAKRKFKVLEPSVAQQRPRKQIKQSQEQRRGSNNSEASSSSVSEDTTLRSTSSTTRYDSNSSMSSLPTSTSHGQDSASDISASSSESSISETGSELEPDTEDEEEEEHIVTVGGPKKPNIQRANGVDTAHGLQARLASLLPQIAEANRLLESRPSGHSMEEVEEGEQHIEMNLGLGVLEQQEDSSDSNSSSSETSEDDREDGEEDDERDLELLKKTIRKQQDHELDIMGRLLGQRHERQNKIIEDVG